MFVFQGSIILTQANTLDKNQWFVEKSFSGKTWFRKQIQFFIVYKVYSYIVSEKYPYI